MSELRDLLLGLASVIAEEAEQNPRFKRKLEAALSGLSGTEGREQQTEKSKGLSELLESQGEAALRDRVGAMKKSELDEQIKIFGIRGLSRSKVGEKKEKLIGHLLSCAREKARLSDTLLSKEEGEGAVQGSLDAAAPADGPSVPEEKAPVLPEKEEKAAESASLPDPILLYHAEGKEGLTEKLQELDLESLKAVIKNYRLDPRKLTARKKEAGELIAFIADKVETRLTKGQVFAEMQ